MPRAAEESHRAPRPTSDRATRIARPSTTSTTTTRNDSLPSRSGTSLTRGSGTTTTTEKEKGQTRRNRPGSDSILVESEAVEEIPLSGDIPEPDDSGMQDTDLDGDNSYTVVKDYSLERFSAEPGHQHAVYIARPAAVIMDEQDYSREVRDLCQVLYDGFTSGSGGKTAPHLSLVVLDIPSNPTHPSYGKAWSLDTTISALSWINVFREHYNIAAGRSSNNHGLTIVLICSLA